VKSSETGVLDVSALEHLVTGDVAALMVTNPNTLGVFEENIIHVAEILHAKGALLYMDGANMNALVGIARPGDFGVDVLHLNLHKTFSTPHGGGGPGAGPVGASGRLRAFLPGPVIEKDDGPERPFYRPAMPEQSIGRLTPWFGNFGMFVRAHAYIRQHGAAGLRANSEHAVLNANYLRVLLRDDYTVPFDRINMHEFVCRGAIAGTPVRALDVSKRLLDYGFHPPTNYFPLIVPEALMIEPTETETKPMLDAFAATMKAIAKEARENPAAVTAAPHTTPLKRLDEVRAARDLVLTDRTGTAT
jgi:glycine dehydrogenase subunit 2